MPWRRMVVSLILATLGTLIIGFFTKQWVLGAVFCFTVAGVNAFRKARG